MNKDIANIWTQIADDEKRKLFREIAFELNLPPVAIEKDWWVVRTLELVYRTEIAPHTVFKGGTSLTKAWNLIDRFSEDIDLALDRKFLGFDKDMSNSQVKKLRGHSFRYITENFFPELQKTYADAGFTDAKLKLSETTSNDQDPLIIEVSYPSVTEQKPYIQPRVLIEIGSRSLREPFTERKIVSLVGEHFAGRNFADTAISIPTVNPERTFLEKIFLLHEEFLQKQEKIRVNRLSRHLYDLEKIMDTEYAANALKDVVLFQNIVHHRERLNHLRGINYSNYTPDKLNIIPPADVIGEWEKDYTSMTEYMIYGEAKKFAALIKRIEELQDRVRSIKIK